MRILRIITKEAIQSLGSNNGFHADKTFIGGKPIEITMSKELQCVKINNVLIPMNNIREIVLDEVPVKKEVTVLEKDFIEATEEITVAKTKKVEEFRNNSDLMDMPLKQKDKITEAKARAKV